MKASISLVSIGSSDRNEEGINCTMIFDLTICSCATAVDSSQTSLPEPSDNTLTRLLDYYPPLCSPSYHHSKFLDQNSSA